MKFEILSYLPETTTKDFTSAETGPLREKSCKADITVSPLLSVLFLTLGILIFSCISEAKADLWNTDQSEFVQAEALPEKKSQPSEPAAPVPQANQVDKFQKNIKEMASQLFANLNDNDPQTGFLADGVAFTVFADLKKLTRTSSFGRYLSEQLMGEFQQQGFPVIEVRKSSSIMVMEKRGEYGLSRDLKEIAAAAPAKALLTGTYTVAGDHIMVNAKILDNTNSSMLSSATMLFEKNALTDSLLSDSASAYPKKEAYVYMKKLEL